MCRSALEGIEYLLTSLQIPFQDGWSQVHGHTRQKTVIEQEEHALQIMGLWAARQAFGVSCVTVCRRCRVREGDGDLEGWGERE